MSYGIEYPNKAPETRKIRTTTIFTAIIVLISSTLGDGVFSAPLGYENSGLAIAILIQCALMMVSYVTFYFLIEVSDLIGVYTYADLAEIVFGNWGVLIVETCGLICSFGSLWAYDILMSHFISSLMIAFGFDDESIWVQHWLICLILFALLYLPLSWLTTPGIINAFSYFGFFSMGFVFFTVIFRYFHPFSGTGNVDPPELVDTDWKTFLTFSTFCSALSYQPNVPIIQGELKRETKRPMYFVSLLTVTGVWLFYAGIGIFGFFSFTTKMETDERAGNILAMYDHRDVLIIIARICSLITITFCYPAAAVSAKESLATIAATIRKIYRHSKYKRRSHKKIKEEETKLGFKRGKKAKYSKGIFSRKEIRKSKERSKPAALTEEEQRKAKEAEENDDIFASELKRLMEEVKESEEQAIEEDDDFEEDDEDSEDVMGDGVEIDDEEAKLETADFVEYLEGKIAVDEEEEIPMTETVDLAPIMEVIEEETEDEKDNDTESDDNREDPSPKMSVSESNSDIQNVRSSSALMTHAHRPHMSYSTSTDKMPLLSPFRPSPLRYAESASSSNFYSNISSSSLHTPVSSSEALTRMYGSSSTSSLSLAHGSPSRPLLSRQNSIARPAPVAQHGLSSLGVLNWVTERNSIHHIVHYLPFRERFAHSIASAVAAPMESDQTPSPSSSPNEMSPQSSVMIMPSHSSSRLVPSASTASLTRLHRSQSKRSLIHMAHVASRAALAQLNETKKEKGKQCLKRVCGGDTQRSLLLGSLVTTVITVVSIVFDKVNFVFDVIGSTACVVVGIIFPSLLYLRLMLNPSRFVRMMETVFFNTEDRTPALRKKMLDILQSKHHFSFCTASAGVCVFIGSVLGLISLVIAIVYDTPLSSLIKR
ncbi:putative Transmembrane amino acid transporter protein [Monocercomonoides exilis]|uniref:putative Transmembrane amino acid transporter protein n=1 Tax=Monocercomonoides exilis TaxID=2049356 RepID=UPI00355949F4|nr:putative Transmembrane amino acid transporter protein [Monocercomonoides exilis]|eukprot:MONOS_6409.1-p1 / transcript=MONOS_6409.1 / gene=MONOS_6409 / organism=Monocercomonoides_exilis_PA203 / gene_product=unspecified product / transcript_product=unspecified product / location=Mono_scaffold00201:79617-82347(-) / protein_length=881 / sequence_SO=supercontig / SO=protein_coding / is_pseudo=false